MSKGKNDITDEKLIETYKTQKERVNYLSRSFEERVKIECRIDEDFKKKLDEIVNKKKKNYEEQLQAVKSTAYYELVCPRCKVSNRIWIENDRDPFDCPICWIGDDWRYTGSKERARGYYASYRKTRSKEVVYIEYYCNSCPTFFAYT